MCVRVSVFVSDGAYKMEFRKRTSVVKSYFLGFGRNRYVLREILFFDARLIHSIKSVSQSNWGQK